MEKDLSPLPPYTFFHSLFLLADRIPSLLSSLSPSLPDKVFFAIILFLILLKLFFSRANACLRDSAISPLFMPLVDMTECEWKFISATVPFPLVFPSPPGVVRKKTREIILEALSSGPTRPVRGPVFTPRPPLAFSLAQT